MSQNQCLEFQDRGQFTCVARDGFGNYSRSLDLEVKVSIDWALAVCESQCYLFPGAEHNSVSGFYRRLLRDSQLEHVPVSRQRLHSSGERLNPLPSKNHEILNVKCARLTWKYNSLFESKFLPLQKMSSKASDDVYRWLLWMFYEHCQDDLLAGVPCKVVQYLEWRYDTMTACQLLADNPICPTFLRTLANKMGYWSLYQIGKTIVNIMWDEMNPVLDSFRDKQ